MDTIIKIFKTPDELAEKFAEELVRMINESAARKKKLTIALSGGRTPKLLFSLLGNRFSESVPWETIHFFWGDERCVTPDDPESNFGMIKTTLLDKIKIPSANIHRIRGERDPSDEAVRYSDEIREFTYQKGGLPVFDLILLGLGEDGHTASIFPGKRSLFNSDKICEIAMHPSSNQQRITLTGKVINNSKNITFLVTGENKAKVVYEIINRPGEADYPAALVHPESGILKWYLDIKAAKFIEKARL